MSEPAVEQEEYEEKKANGEPLHKSVSFTELLKAFRRRLNWNIDWATYF
jgi:hypothetical protein